MPFPTHLRNHQTYQRMNLFYLFWNIHKYFISQHSALSSATLVTSCLFVLSNILLFIKNYIYILNKTT